MKWIAGILIALEMGVFSHYGAEEPKKTASIPQIQASKEVFENIDIVKAKLAFEGRRAVKPVALFHIDTELISSMRKGEVIPLKDIEAHTFLLKVKAKHYFRNSIVIRFQCQVAENPCSAAITIGSTHTYMLLHTLYGTYEMEARNDVAYFYKQ